MTSIASDFSANDLIRICNSFVYDDAKSLGQLDLRSAERAIQRKDIDAYMNICARSNMYDRTGYLPEEVVTFLAHSKMMSMMSTENALSLLEMGAPRACKVGDYEFTVIDEQIQSPHLIMHILDASYIAPLFEEEMDVHLRCSRLITDTPAVMSHALQHSDDAFYDICQLLGMIYTTYGASLTGNIKTLCDIIHVAGDTYGVAVDYLLSVYDIEPENLPRLVLTIPNFEMMKTIFVALGSPKVDTLKGNQAFLHHLSMLAQPTEIFELLDEYGLLDPTCPITLDILIHGCSDIMMVLNEYGFEEDIVRTHVRQRLSARISEGNLPNRFLHRRQFETFVVNLRDLNILSLSEYSVFARTYRKG